MKVALPRILITPGEPAGIGPDVVIELAQQNFQAELIVVADETLLTTRAKKLKLPLTLIEWSQEKRQPHKAQYLQIIPIPLKEICEPRKLAVANSHYVLATLEKAAQLCLEKKADALVTGPIHKAIMNEAGISFTGHTEFLAKMASVSTTVMLFVVDTLRIALATTHLPLSEVPQAIKKKSLAEVIHVLHQDLINKFKIKNPRLLVCGLNPHAGEGGYLGREEIEIITPVITALQKQGVHISGPYPADTLFATQADNADAMLSMYHDQALPLIKYLGFNKAVNVTLGLPFIRTSVDHGTALELAGSGKADAGSLIEAVKLAVQLSARLH